MVTANSRANTSPATAARIEADPSQDTAWQMQSSVRHVPNSDGHGPQVGTSPSTGDLTAGHREGNTGNSRGPTVTETEGSSQPMPYRPRPNAGPMGVTS